MAEFSKFQYGVTEEKDKITEKDRESKMNTTDTNDNEKSHEKTTDKTTDKTSDTKDNTTNDEMETDDNESHILQKFRFPLGSVVAKVDMFFLADEEYETTLEGNNTHDITTHTI
jgi:hypothetical protein